MVDKTFVFYIVLITIIIPSTGFLGFPEPEPPPQFPVNLLSGITTRNHEMITEGLQSVAS